ncbi:MAG: type II toxin-antitoxin system VapC family toxin [Dehalococcoidia bacterium]|nr:type II toxin-antitoxin system VapC family toxin [Dehalococcoidia bacterium]
MILVDTSVWVSHLRGDDAHLRKLLNDGKVCCHPFVVGELACGNLQNRAEILSLLQLLPAAKTATHEEVLRFIETQSLMGIGLSFIDVHLLASALLSEAPLWTFDKALKAASTKLNVDYQ